MGSSSLLETRFFWFWRANSEPVSSSSDDVHWDAHIPKSFPGCSARTLQRERGGFLCQGIILSCWFLSVNQRFSDLLSSSGVKMKDACCKVLERLLGCGDLLAFQLSYRIRLATDTALGREGRLFYTQGTWRTGGLSLPEWSVSTVSSSGSDRL